MSDQRGFISAGQFHPDPYTQSRNAERTLNAAIVQADISRGYEEYLEIFDEFYADDIEGSSETMKEPLRGKERVRSLLFSFLAPLHAMAEVGGVSISIREMPIPGDAIDETHSAWTLKLVGMSGKTCTVSWRILRKWDESRVVLEHHYDYQQSGEPLTPEDLSFDPPEAELGFSNALVNAPGAFAETRRGHLKMGSYSHGPVRARHKRHQKAATAQSRRPDRRVGT
jgi:hypothetical protein